MDSDQPAERVCANGITHAPDCADDAGRSAGDNARGPSERAANWGVAFPFFHCANRPYRITGTVADACASSNQHTHLVADQNTAAL